MSGSGYTACPCCGYDTVSDDTDAPELCSDCEEAGCDESGDESCCQPDLDEYIDCGGSTAVGSPDPHVCVVVRYRTHMIERDGTEFTSSVAFDTNGNRSAEAALKQACIAGHLMGTYYWCTEEGTGRFLNGIGPTGQWITCSRVSTAPAYISGRLTPVYFPAVRIYNPHPRLTYRRIRGSSETLVAYDTRDATLGPEPVGWVLGEDIPTGSVVS